MRLIKGMKAYFAAAMVDAFAGTIMLVSIPADPKNGWALGLSKARWGMMASLIGVGLVCLWVNIQLWRNPAWTQKMQRGSSRLMQNGKLAGGVFTLALSGVAAAGLLLIEWISPGEGDYRDLLIRMGPLLLVGGAVCAQTIVLMLASMPKGRQRTWLVWTALAGASIPGQYLLLPWKHHNLMAVSLPVLLLGIA
ncbi:MAG: hypothetical protein OEZ02_09000, partial [Anaerolineae bacterium]|nr:hypothetical protein [Anaerolineae bacterium]